MSDGRDRDICFCWTATRLPCFVTLSCGAKSPTGIYRTLSTLARVLKVCEIFSHPLPSFAQEPTNHMDVAVIDWLQNRLVDPSITLVLVRGERALESMHWRACTGEYALGSMHWGVFTRH